MLSAIRIRDAEQVPAFEEARGDESYQCPECQSAVVLKKCRLKVDHFAHKPPITCAYGKGESEIHRRSKMEIFKGLEGRSEVEKLELERGGLTTIRPDVSFKVAGSYVAFEVQLSALTVEKIIQRTSEYAKKKIALLWLAQWSDRLFKKPYVPSAWERWVHAANYGRVYYWKTGLTVIPCHFGECYLWKPLSEWYSEDGEEASAGNCWKKSKRYFVPIIGPTMNLLDDFKEQPRPLWEEGRFPVPAHKLWIDKHIRSWPKISMPEMPPPDSSKSAMSIDGETISKQPKD